MTNEMTAEEAVKQIKENCYFASISEKTKQALDMAIKALEQENVLDKIRAEIERRKKNSGGEPSRDLAFNVCLQIIDKYKAESEDKE